MKARRETITAGHIVGGGQTLGQLTSGKKVFVWGALPGETVEVRLTKQKSSHAEAVVEQVIAPSPERIAPRDPDSYLSTSPWQIMDFAAEQRAKVQLVEEAFRLHHVALPHEIEIYSDDTQYGYRNKVEFSWWGDVGEQGSETLDLAFFRRGSKGKIPVDGTSLARPEINQTARAIRDALRAEGISARTLKTLLIRCNQSGQCAWQLYVKDRSLDWKNILHNIFTCQGATLAELATGGEVIYSDPRSPASRITERLASYGDIVLSDTILGVPFRYATEGFFQVNVPVYEQALRDMRQYIAAPESESSARHSDETSAAPLFSDGDQEITGAKPSRRSNEPRTGTGRTILDLYSGVGTIGLTIGGADCTLIEIDEHAVREMRRNITELSSSATAVLAPSEKALEYITSDKTIIVDPPRAGLHADVVARLLETQPPRIIYLSCNPVTQARDVALLLENYRIIHHRAYNFFPRTPHIEHLVVLDNMI